MYCQKCGKELYPGSNFCFYCGYSNAVGSASGDNNSIKTKEKKAGAGIIIFFFCFLTLYGFGSLVNSSAGGEWLFAITSGIGIIVSIIYAVDLHKGKYNSFSGKVITVLSIINIVLSVLLIFTADSFAFGLGRSLLPLLFSICTIQKVKNNSEIHKV